MGADAFFVPTWPAPPRVRALMTTRYGGVSEGPFGAADGGGLNLGLGSGDDRAAVLANRARLRERLPADPAWLHQVHGSRGVAAATAIDAPDADASWTDEPGRVCAVLVADCLPVLFAQRDGSRVAAAHAGWRGLAAGVLEATLARGGFDPGETIAWLGPAIGPAYFEVGDDVRDAFVRSSDDATRGAFRAHRPGKWLADLAELAAIRLAAVGVRDVHRSGLCTVSDPDRFYSYRRDRVTGRMAALVWIER